MGDADLIEVATEFRDGILNGASSDLMCFAICAPLEGFLRYRYNVDATLAWWDTVEENHFWLLLPDGRVLDPTIDQFDPTMGSVYLGSPTKWHSAPVAERAA